MQFIEIDHPATHAAKRRALERLGIHPPNLSLCAVDLATMGLDEVLWGLKGRSPENKSVIQAEGLFF